MTYKMIRTELKGFPIQYDENVVKHLNHIVGNTSNTNNSMLEKIGMAIPEYSKHITHGKTEDKYIWFGTLEFNIKDTKIAVLFPWHQDWQNPETRMDRSINVYSNKKLPDEVVESLLEKIAHEIEIRVN